MNQRVLLVDGHSAIHAWPELKAAIRGSGRDATAPARQLLVNELSLIHDRGGMDVAVVFDGPGRVLPDTETVDTGGVRVIFSDGKRSADGVIERVVAKHAGDVDITVASNDRLVLDAAMAGGAGAITIRSLREMVDSSDSDFRDRFSRHFR